MWYDSLEYGKQTCFHSKLYRQIGGNVDILLINEYVLAFWLPDEDQIRSWLDSEIDTMIGRAAPRNSFLEAGDLLPVRSCFPMRDQIKKKEKEEEEYDDDDDDDDADESDDD